MEIFTSYFRGNVVVVIVYTIGMPLSAELKINNKTVFTVEAANVGGNNDTFGNDKYHYKVTDHRDDSVKEGILFHRRSLGLKILVARILESSY